MELLLKKFSTYSLLTFLFRKVNPFVLQVNTPAVPTKGALPVERKKGILTLTLVISRESMEIPTVKRGNFMFKLFKIKTKLKMQLEEYIDFKSKTSPFIAETHNKVIGDFIKSLNYKEVSEITLHDINVYHARMGAETTQYTTIGAMQALRAFMRYHKRNTNIKPDKITNEGVKELQPVVKNVIIPQMKAKRVGRPYGSIELIKKIKRLKDREDLSFRKIGLVTGKNVSHVYKMYRYDLTNS